jgi:hypothetical protein
MGACARLLVATTGMRQDVDLRIAIASNCIELSHITGITSPHCHM